MFNNRFYIYFLSIIATGLVVYFISVLGWYPIALVDSNWIMASSLKKHSDASLQYYKAALGGGVLPQGIDQEFRRAALDQLIEDALIYNELRQRIGDDGDRLVNEKLNSLNVNIADIGSAVEVLYGLSFADFKELILVPRAQREVLIESLAVDKLEIDDWLANIKTNSKVLIFSFRFSWRDKTVEINN